MSKKFVRSIAVIAIAVWMASPAFAEDVSEDIVNATVGKWLIASEDGSVGCNVTLEKDKTIGGRVVSEGIPCGTPWHDELAAWELSDGGIVFRDATRKEIINFQEQEGGPWKTPLDVTPVVYFVPEPGEMDRVNDRELRRKMGLDRQGRQSPLPHRSSQRAFTAA